VGQQFLEGGQITAGKRRDTAAALVVRQEDTHPEMIQHLDGTVGNGGKHLVDETSGENGHLEARPTGRPIDGGHLTVKGHRGQGPEMAILDQGRHHPGAGGSDDIVDRTGENFLESCPPLGQSIE
jgi:hypothetical protein